jgi:hypothetical protein
MAKYCDACRQSYPDDHERCPHCSGHGTHGGAANGVLKDARQVPEEAPCVSDPEIDLDNPGASPPSPAAGPPSGASFVSWTELLPTKKGLAPPGDTPIQFDPPSRNTLGPPSEKSEPAEGEIDLDQPTQAPRPADGPPSGASFVSWTSLLRNREAHQREDRPVEFSSPAPQVRVLNFPAGAAPDGGAIRTARGLMDMPPDAAPGVPVRWAWIGGILIGFLVALALCFALWAAGFELPPFGRAPARLPSDGSAPPVKSPAPPSQQ